jgi:hypothetical protein
MRRVAVITVLGALFLAGCVVAPTPDVSTTTTQVVSPPDPASDRLGWEDGYWYNETLDVTNSDGLTERERNAVVGRAMARVEYIRNLEFKESVSVEVISRAEYRNDSGESDHTDAFRRFDNAKFEAMLLIGESGDSLGTQDETLGESVLGYYSPSKDAIVLVSESETPTLDGELTLGHELVHALQDQHFDLSNRSALTRDQYNGQNGLIEGDPQRVQFAYQDYCEGEWQCIAAVDDDSEDGTDGDSGSSIHYGVYFLNYFPYSDGYTFVEDLRQRGGWDAVDAAYENPPVSAEQVISPEKYPDETPVTVDLADQTRNGWTRVDPTVDLDRERKPYATLGQSALSTMFMYTAFDEYNESRVVEPEEFLNREGTGDPLNYDLPETSGWNGDRLHVYERAGETAYAWRIVWESPSEAREFAAGYRELLAHWGGSRVDDGRWSIESGPFADAFAIDVDGETVTIVNAPRVADLGDVHPSGRGP